MDNLTGTHSTLDIFGIRDCFLMKFRPAQLERLNTLARTHPILLDGEFYLRATSRNGVDFIFPNTTTPPGHNVIVWSRIWDGKEVLCAANLDEQHPAILYATIDNGLHEANSRMQCLYASELSPAELNVEERNGKAIRLTIPPHALVIYQ
jgi:hypothetical protein